MNLELRHLKMVCTIAEAGSVTKAAARLGLAQPALTTQLQRIERTLGGVLFERDRRGARATALGELVLSRARVLLPAMQELEEEANRLASSTAPMSRCRIGAANGSILGGLIERLSQRNPGISITTQTSWSGSELAELVAIGRLDFVLIGVCGDALPAVSANAGGLIWREVGVDIVSVLLSQLHPLADEDEVELAKLATAQWAVTPGDGCFGDCFAAACARAGFAPRATFETDVRGCIDLVESGTAVALCRGTFRPAAGLVTVPLAGAPLRWRHLLGWHRDSVVAEFAEAVATYAAQSFLTAVARNPRYAMWRSRNGMS